MSNREDWLKERQTLLTASDAAAALGLNPYVTPLQLYAQKLGLVEVEENEAMKWGKRLEEPIAQGFAEDTGRVVIHPPEYEIVRHPDALWLGCTLDRENVGCEKTPAPIVTRSREDGLEIGPLEIKNPGQGQKSKWDEEPPLVYQIQLQIQMACTKAQWGTLCALIGGASLRWADLLRNDDFLNVAMPRLEEFWLRVQRHEPPEVTSHEDVGAVKALFPGADVPEVELDEEKSKVVEVYLTSVDIAAKAGEMAGYWEAKARLIMGDSQVARLSDGRIVKSKLVDVPEYEKKAQPARIVPANSYRKALTLVTK